MIMRSAAFEAALRALSPDQVEAFVDDGEVSTCTTGYDNGGSTGLEIFENGLELGLKAGGRPVQMARLGGTDGETAYFAVGTEEEVLAKVARSGES